VNLVRPEAVNVFRETITSRYAERTGRTATVHVVETADGAGVIRT